MVQQTITRDKKSFLQNDPLFVCGMLVVYGVCIPGLMGATFRGLSRRKSGSLGLYIEVDEKNSAVVWFDNFGFQSRSSNP